MSQGQGTILLVEDEPLVRALAARALREKGYAVLEAQNGVEALRITREQPLEAIDLLLTDMVMPLMSGKKLADRYREARPDARVLYTSGYTDRTGFGDEAQPPRTGFIGKPFTPLMLSEKVKEILGS